MSLYLRRREFIALLGGSAAVQSLGAYGQAPKLPVIGFLSIAPPRVLATYVAAFRDGMSTLGYAEGRNMAITYRSAEDNSDQLGTLADDLVRSQVHLIVASGGLLSARAAMKATASIPILFLGGFDPVELGMVASLNKPGGNATGVSLFSTELVPKHLELLYALGPRIQKVAVLLNPASVTSDIEAREALAVARLKGYQLALFEASTPSGIDAAFILVGCTS
jgi:putative ABC transport system substrate-binding protein